MFSREFWEISKNTYFTEYLWTTASFYCFNWSIRLLIITINNFLTPKEGSTPTLNDVLINCTTGEVARQCRNISALMFGKNKQFLWYGTSFTWNYHNVEIAKDV